MEEDLLGKCVFMTPSRITLGRCDGGDWTLMQVNEGHFQRKEGFCVEQLHLYFVKNELVQKPYNHLSMSQIH
jgi:hypothetical protein